MSENSSLYLSDSLNSSSLSLLSNGDWQYQLEDLPNELLTLILGYLPLPDLANARLVCSRLQKLVDDNGSKHLWAMATLEEDCQWLTTENRQLIQRAADAGNVEALIMLAVAYLYSEGVPEGAGKGIYDAYNGVKATECLIRAEQLSPNTPPFSWVLFRPPWSLNSMCCKACVCQRMKEHCSQQNMICTGIHYCIGKVLSFHDEESGDAGHWFELGSQAGCLHSQLEVWRQKHKHNLFLDSYEPLRQLRATVFAGCPSFEAQLELASAYARGYYGGKSRGEAMAFVREVFSEARPVLSERVYKLHSSMSHNVRFILLDWIAEVAGMKSFPPHIVHLAISLVDRYLLKRTIPRSNLQLLGITALLLAARWSSEYIVTVREASWLTEETYQYEDVVRMMGSLVAAFKGDIKRVTIVDYLDILLDLLNTNFPTVNNTLVRNMAYYLSECLLLHAKFGRYSASHLAAACLLEARILLGTEYPWPQCMVEATGLTVTDLRRCCLAIYDECLTGKNSITDFRKIKLESVATRYASDEFGCISKQDLMSYKELKEQLGIDPDTTLALFTPSPKPTPKRLRCPNKLLSFLSDSTYLTPGANQPSSESDSSSINSDVSVQSSLADRFDNVEDLSESDSDPVRFSPSELDAISSPFSPSQCSSETLIFNPNRSKFPQPFFDDEALSSPPKSSPLQELPGSQEQASMACSLSHEPMDTEDTLFAQSEGLARNTPLEMRVLPSTTGPTPQSTQGFVQGSEETPIEYEVPHPRYGLPLKQHLLSSVSNSLKSLPFRDQSARVPLKSVTNIPSPSAGQEPSSKKTDPAACPRRNPRRKVRCASRK